LGLVSEFDASGSQTHVSVGSQANSILRLSQPNRGGAMTGKALLIGAVLAVVGWFGLVPVSSVMAGDSQASYQIAQNESYDGAGPMWNRQNLHYVDWYQGQEGKWRRGPQGKWHWYPLHEGDSWYWGQRGHWYKEHNGWQFGSDGLVCNNNGRDCRYGGYLPPNGEGMVNRQNPNLYWQCDSNGNHCHWARRPL
jgi:hypothetical protein